MCRIHKLNWYHTLKTDTPAAEGCSVFCQGDEKNFERSLYCEATFQRSMTIYFQAEEIL